ncbi:hypothetical protein ACFSC3_13825 [Sphingomonas floccifaciens]|uniref:Uncharacterized protein n=1 Tax=Sphingomonas floccifaciens TaxID=1844115 RepID=A0ABW4NJ44_9SPHN
MNEQGAESASARIDRALARIEAAAQRLVRDRTDLERRHDALRDQVSEAIAALDSLIATEEDDD